MSDRCAATPGGRGERCVGPLRRCVACGEDARDARLLPVVDDEKRPEDAEAVMLARFEKLTLAALMRGVRLPAPHTKASGERR